MPLPLSKTLTPTSTEELCAAVRDCHDSATPLYPLGGGTSLEYGLPAKVSGIGISLAKLNRVIDYPARDMTITLEPGVSMAEIARTLATERQQLPFDVPQAEHATLGGVIATNWNGPRRYGYGSVRDYVIGISAVDGRGLPFKGGGRVVKNVAGYDFCKLLTGSFGVLGVISQVTLKVRPLAEKSLLLAVACNDLAHTEQVLAALQNSAATPVSISLLAGPEWNDSLAELFPETLSSKPHAALVIGLEGTADEVDWMHARLSEEWSLGFARHGVVDAAEKLGREIVEWSAAGNAPLVLKANVPPSGVTALFAAFREVDPQCSLLAHAGSGIVFAKLTEFPKAGLSRVLIGKLQPAAAALGGNVIVLSNPSGAEMTQQCVWGSCDSLELMRGVKRNFDPQAILNPGRFVV